MRAHLSTMNQNQPTEAVALFLDHDVEKAQFAVKYLMAQLAVRPLRVSIFLQGSESDDADGMFDDVRTYLAQCRHTLRAIEPVGVMDEECLTAGRTVDACIAPLLQQYGRVVLLDEGTCRSPWTLDGEKVVVTS